MLNSATGTPLADTCGANIAAGYTTEEVPTCRDRAKNHECSRPVITQTKPNQPTSQGPHRWVFEGQDRTEGKRQVAERKAPGLARPVLPIRFLLAAIPVPSFFGLFTLTYLMDRAAQLGRHVPPVPTWACHFLQKPPAPLKVLLCIDKTSLSLVSSRLNGPSSFSPSSYVRCYKPLIIFVALCWTLSSMSMSHLYWGAQHWTQHSRCLTSAEQRGRITSLHLLEMLCRVQPQTPISLCCHKGSSLAHGQLAVHQDPQGLFCKAAFQLVSHSLS
ncbi:hypothetical protein QYF61_011716 [Mycteria americana]|uniref:Uncharacterized protein n=1 Tax=Mycteria americana TaxID=33587 RepID=A0AAN7SG51_MYCAM|nr:hypothetical protein QYF61_011716 [Mycteria americana]